MKNVITTIAIAVAAATAFPTTANTIQDQIDSQFRFGTGEYKMRFEREIQQVCGAILQSADTSTLSLGHESIDEYPPVVYKVYDNGEINTPVNIEITGVNTYGDRWTDLYEFDEFLWIKMETQDGLGNFTEKRGNLRGMVHQVTQGAELRFNAKADLDEADLEAGLWFVGPRLQVNCFSAPQ